MANSLRAKISKLRHDRQITEEEYKEFIKKLDGHDKQIINDFCKEYKNFQSDEGICDLQEDCSFSDGWCIDCFKEKWLKEQK